MRIAFPVLALRSDRGGLCTLACLDHTVCLCVVTGTNEFSTQPPKRSSSSANGCGTVGPRSFVSVLFKARNERPHAAAAARPDEDLYVKRAAYSHECKSLACKRRAVSLRCHNTAERSTIAFVLRPLEPSPAGYRYLERRVNHQHVHRVMCTIEPEAHFVRTTMTA